MSKFLRCTRHFNNDAIDATATLNVLVRIENVSRCGFETNGLAHFNLFLQENLEVIDLLCTIACTGFALCKHCGCKSICFCNETVTGSNEVCLALELDDRSLAAFDDESNNTLSVVTIVALCTCCKTLFTKPLLRCFDLAAVFFKSFLAVHHAGARCLTKALNIFRCVRHDYSAAGVSVDFFAARRASRSA
ncbi:unannotated protein [freshwater metagenome]|uniref:Unannotated protein n=1 Tax=freshwater metagenome TaxID=449393 RepID=A0A6J6HLZ9_9ZZZZ